MPLFKTKYNDVRKAIEAIVLGKEYDISKAPNEFFSNEEFIIKAFDRFQTTIFDDRFDDFRDLSKKLNIVQILLTHKNELKHSNLSDEWVLNNIYMGDLIKSGVARYLDKSSIQGHFTNAIKLFQNRRFMYIPVDNDNSWTALDNHEIFHIIKYKGDFSSKAIGVDSNAQTILNLFPIPNLSDCITYFPDSKLLFLYYYKKINAKDGLGIITSVADKLKSKDGKEINIATLFTEPEIFKGKDEVFENEMQEFLKSDFPIQTTPKENLDTTFIKHFIIPCIDKLIQGENVVLLNQSSQGKRPFNEIIENGKFINEIVIQSLLSLPANIANQISFSTQINNCANYLYQFSTTNKLVKEDLPKNCFIVDVDTGCKDYIPQTEYAKQMLSKLNQNESKQPTEEVVEQPSSEHKPNDHELS